MAARPKSSANDSLCASETRSLPRSALAVCGLFLLALYGACWNGRWDVKGDSAQYLLLSESLASGAGYSIGGTPHTYFPPGFPLLLAGLQAIGIRDMLWLNLAMLVMHLAMLAVGYRLLCMVTTPRRAFLAAMLAACAHPVFKGSVAILSDTPFALFVIAGLYGYRRGCRDRSSWLEFGTLALAGACWMRIVGYLIAAAAGGALLLQMPAAGRKRAILNVAMLGLLVAAAGGWFFNQYQLGQMSRTDVYTGEVSEVTERAGSQLLVRPVWNAVLAGKSFALFFSGQELESISGFVLFIMPVVAGMVIHFRRGEYIIALVPAVYLAALIFIRPPIPRYLLPVAPFIALFFIEWLEVLRERLFVWWKKYDLVAVTVAGFVIACLVRDVRFIADRHAPLETAQGSDWRKLAEFIDQRTDPAAAFTCTREGALVAYLTKRFWKEPGPLFAQSQGTTEGLDAALRAAQVDFVMLEPVERCPGRLRNAQELLESLVADTSRFELAIEEGNVRIYRRVTAPIASQDFKQIF